MLACWVLPALLTVAVVLFMWLDAAKYPDTTAQRQKDRLWPAVFVSISVALVSYSVLVRVEEDVAAAQAFDTIQTPLAGHHLLIRYPHTLRFDAPETDPPTLTVWVERNAGAAPLTVTVELSSATLLFVDAAGMSGEPRLTLGVNGGSRLQDVRLGPLRSNSDERVIVDVTVRDASGKELLTRLLTIARETRAAFYWRVFTTRFFGDAGLALAVASAVLGIGWQLLNEGRQTRVGQQRERIRELRDLFERDLIEWALVSKTLEQEARKGWEEQARQELREALRKQNQQLTTAATQVRVKRLLHDAAEYYRAGDVQRCATALDLVIRAYASKDDRLADLPHRLPDARTADKQQAETILRVCGVLLNQFRLDANELAAAALEAMALQPDDHEAKQCLLHTIRAPGNEADVALSKLAVNDPRIRRHLTNHFPWTFAWAPIASAPGMVSRTRSVTSWLEANGLKMHPFDAYELQAHHAFLKRVTLPAAQRAAIIRSQLLAAVGLRFDRYVAAIALYHELHQPTARQMPVMVTLFDHDTAGHPALLSRVAQAAGKTWVRLIADQPGVLLWLPEDEQALLAEWFVWLSGSPQAVRQQLRRAGLRSGIQEQIVLRQLDSLLSGVDRSAPRSDRLLNWLAIRPPEVSHMCVIAIDYTENQRAGLLAELLSKTQDAGVVWKLFTSPTRRRMVEKIDSIALEWSEHELLALLDFAVDGAGGPGQTLNDLLEMDDPASNEEEFLRAMVKHAHGSFERALAICQRALAHHLDTVSDPNDPNYPFLNEHDFKAALQRT